ncbi:MarR family transcriptional regulator [Cytobacillus purgationiresistens]|uniref:DNA-binding MarR family transcriptional regulator n=1 Tax=Cytobacillus purgationiresistens TaxID=863449 RepID=A0ABU0API1_9BACI|nr:MarR family transcriptional regulator [Cytobacillus purgationiresistens]MDQ0273196.1 DNA-binding MarR family transcriptional regulator [Cytobacillus purgationiresistens]
MDENREKSIQAFIIEILQSTHMIGLFIRNEKLSENLVLLLLKLKLAGAMKITDISASYGVTPAAATNMCDKVERYGYIERLRLAGDRRVVKVSLTPYGKANIDEMFAELSSHQLNLITSHLAAINHSVKKLEQILG